MILHNDVNDINMHKKAVVFFWKIEISFDCSLTGIMYESGFYSSDGMLLLYQHGWGK